MKKIFLIVLILVAVAFFVWLIFFRQPNGVIPPSINVQDNPVAGPDSSTEIPSPVLSDNTDIGTTIASESSGWDKPLEKNGKGVEYKNYYLTYSNGAGVSMVQQIGKDIFDKFMIDNPTGIANGNLIRIYLPLNSVLVSQFYLRGTVKK